MNGGKRVRRLFVRCQAVTLISAGLVVGACVTDADGRNATASEVTSAGATLSGNYLAARHARSVQADDDAATFLQAALAKSPDDRLLLSRAMAAFLLAGRVEEAIPIARRLDSADEEAPLADLTLVIGEIKAADYKAALARLRASPQAGHAVFILPIVTAWTEFGLGKVDQALATLDPAGRNPGLAALYRLHAAWISEAAGRTDQAMAYLDAVLKDQNEPWLRLVELAGGLKERAGQRQEALALYRGYLQRFPDSSLLAPALARAAGGAAAPAAEIRNARDGVAEVMLDAAGVLSRQNSREVALMMGELGLYLRPDFPALQLMVGDLLEAFDREDDANRVYARVDRASPMSWPARLSIARNLERTERFDEAAKLLRELARERPRDPEPLSELGDMYRKRDRFAEAVEAYDATFARIGTPEPRHWRLLYVRGIVLERTKDWPRAEADFLKALEFEPDQPFVLNYLGYSWVEQGHNLERAEAMIRKAVELRPTDGYIVDSLGWVLYRLGRKEEAVEPLERAVELKPEDPVINDHLGDAYWAVGRQREARFQWRAALDLKPEPDLKSQIEAKLEHGPVKEANAAPR